MKRRIVAACLLLVAFVVAGCASSPLASRSIPVQIGTNEHQVQLKGTRGATTTIALYVDGVQQGENNTFSPFSSTYTFRAEIEKSVMEVPCAWEATSNGWGQKADCSVYQNNKEVAKIPTF